MLCVRKHYDRSETGAGNKPEQTVPIEDGVSTRHERCVSKASQKWLFALFLTEAASGSIE